MTTRRGFLAALTATAAGLWAGVRPTRAEPIVGDVSERARITVERWAREFGDCRLLLDGGDVTNRCSFCNPAQGWCDLDEVGDDGKRLMVNDAPWVKRHFGKVEIVQPSGRFIDVRTLLMPGLGTAYPGPRRNVVRVTGSNVMPDGTIDVTFHYAD